PGGLILLAVWLGGRAEEMARLGSTGIERQRGVELPPRLRGDDAAGSRGDGLAEIGVARPALAVIGDRIAEGADRIVIAPEPQQHRRQHVPAATVGWILLPMGLDLRPQIFPPPAGLGG